MLYLIGQNVNFSLLMNLAPQLFQSICSFSCLNDVAGYLWILICTIIIFSLNVLFVFINISRVLNNEKGGKNSALLFCKPHCMAWKLFSLCACLLFLVICFCDASWLVSESIPWYAHFIKVFLWMSLSTDFQWKSSFDIFISFRRHLREKFRTVLLLLLFRDCKIFKSLHI